MPQCVKGLITNPNPGLILRTERVEGKTPKVVPLALHAHYGPCFYTRAHTHRPEETVVILKSEKNIGI